jgi:putative spermidine/putrescine transport system permease protein
MSTVTASWLHRPDRSGSSGRGRARRHARQITDALARKLGLIVTVALLLAFFVWPLADIVVRSFDSSGRASYAGIDFSLDNYRYVVSDRGLRNVFRNTAYVGAVATAISVLLAFPSAYLMSRVGKVAASRLYMLFLIPFTISIIVRLFAVQQLLAARGPVNEALESLGLSRHDLMFNNFSTILGMVNYLLPVTLLIVYSGMSGIDPTLTTAAKASGASGWTAFRRVYLPLLRPALGGATLLTFVLAMGFFLVPAMLGGVKNMTVATYIANNVGNYRWGPASAVGVLLLVASSILALAAVKFSGLGGILVAGSGKGVARAEPLRGGPLQAVLWSITAVSLAILIAPLVIVVPLGFSDSNYVVWPPTGFTTDWYREVFGSPFWIAAAFKSVRVGLMTALLAAVMGFIAARSIMTARSGAIRGLLTVVFYAPMVAPVILIAIGTINTQARMGLLGTDFGLAAVHASLALPLTVTVFLAALGSLDPRIEQAAWSLGATQRHTVRRIVIPMVLPSAVGAAVLALLHSWDEATIALFQSSGTNVTLPVAIFSFVREGVQPTIPAIGTILIALVLLAFSVLSLATWWSHRQARPRAAEADPRPRPPLGGSL